MELERLIEMLTDPYRYKWSGAMISAVCEKAAAALRAAAEREREKDEHIEWLTHTAQGWKERAEAAERQRDELRAAWVWHWSTSFNNMPEEAANRCVELNLETYRRRALPEGEAR